MKPYRIIITIAFLFCNVVFFSCNDVCSCKKVSCPAYKNTNFDQWFPYVSQQKVSFIDTAQRLPDDTILIGNISARQAYEANKGCLNGESGCSSDKYISSSDFSFSMSYNSTSDWDGSVLDSNYNLTFRDFSINAKSLSSAGFINTNSPAANYNSIQLNGKNYQNVQTIFRADTTGGNYDVYQIYLQRGTGLLAWRSQYAKTLFVLK